jgi:hypothetical protein
VQELAQQQVREPLDLYPIKHVLQQDVSIQPLYQKKLELLEPRLLLVTQFELQPMEQQVQELEPRQLIKW